MNLTKPPDCRTSFRAWGDGLRLLIGAKPEGTAPRQRLLRGATSCIPAVVRIHAPAVYRSF